MRLQSLFENNVYLSITCSVLCVVFATCLFVKNKRLKINPISLFLGLLIGFIAFGLETEIVRIYELGDSITSMMTFQLLLLLLSMLFFAKSTIRILVSKKVAYVDSLFVIAGFLGVIGIIFFMYVMPNGIIINKLKNLLPFISYGYLAACFLLNVRGLKHVGYLLAGFSSLAVASVFGINLFDESILAQQDLWYLPCVCYTLLTMSLFMIKCDSLIQALKNSKKEITKYNTRIKDFIKYSPFPIILSRLSDDKILLANNNAIKLFGIFPEELDRYKLKDFFADSESRHLLGLKLEKEREVQDFEVLVKTPLSENPFWLLASINIIDYDYDIVLYSAFQDITSRKNREVLLKHQALRDPLTSLYNRRYFEEEVNKKILEAKVSSSPYGLLMIDIDHFKNINDTYGHKTGDKVLIELAATCEKALRENDIVARYGGEEFVVFLPTLDKANAIIVAERLRITIANILVYADDGREIKFTASIGVSYNAISDNINMLVKTADDALYKAKRSGRNKVVVFEQEDLKDFDVSEKKDNSQNHHPIFDKEEVVEVSLLDDPATSYVQKNTINQQEPNENTSIRIDDEQL